MREKEDLKKRMELIDLEVRRLEETDIASAGKKGRRSLGKARVKGGGKKYSEKKSTLLQLRMSYGKMQSKLDGATIEAEEYIQRIDDSRMRQIMRLRYMETRDGRQMTWREIANRMGETEDSCRKAHDRWLDGGL